MPCPGDPSSICGGPNRLSLYGASFLPPPVTPYPRGPVTMTHYEGCFTEIAGGRALSGASAVSATEMTTEACGEYCINSGFTWFGLEYSSECFCGHALDEDSKVAPEEECNMSCTGAPTEACGGSNRLSVWRWK